MIFPNSKTQQEFIQKKVKEWVDILKLNDHRITIEFKINLDVLAEVNRNLIKNHVLTIPLYFRADYYETWNDGVQDRYYNWKEFLEELVIHELVHAKLGKVICLYERYISDEQLMNAKELAENIEEEYFVDSMSRVLLEMRNKKGK